jgi:DNA (cytosine-5)-methyltransferase 1
MNRKKYIDLFSGCGGLSLGFFNSKLWQGLFAVEKDSFAFSTLKHNLIDNHGHFEWPTWLTKTNHDIKEVLDSKRSELTALEGTVDLVTGGPPCQGFSMAGRRESSDQRNELVLHYLEIIKIVKPKVIFFENVEGFTLPFTKDGDRRFSNEVEEELHNLGYTAKGKLVNFSEFGVPQRRRRYIIVGFAEGIATGKDFFEELEVRREAFLQKRGLKAKTSLKDAISDLERKHGTIEVEGDKFKYGEYGESTSPYQDYVRSSHIITPDSHRFANHTTEIETRLKEVISSNLSTSKAVRERFGLNKSSIKLLQATDCSPTLTTLPDDYVHYSEPRILTVREYARIQSFDDWFEFKGKYTTGGHLRTKQVPRYSQIGNAIPPLFAELCAETIDGLLYEQSTL